MPKVLIVDDALTERVRVSGIASRWLNCTILDADNGRTALQQIEKHMPDLVLTDLHMPEMDGLQLVSAVREDYPHIPVVLMTAQGSEEVAAAALRCGAASYVPKIRLANDLVTTLNQVYSTAQVAHSQSRLMHYMTNTDTRFVLPNDLPLITVCVNQLLNMLRCLPLGDEAERLRVGIALKEALNNAYFHGNLEVRAETGDDASKYVEVAAQKCRLEPYVHRRIRVQAQISRDVARFVVGDDGCGFDIGRANEEHDLSDANRWGRGITLMKSIMDECSYNDAGNEVTMLKRAVLPFDDDDEGEELD
ncbi:MAG: response regulator [Fuerstiella sp.]